MAKHGRTMRGGDLEAGAERNKALDMALGQIEKQFGTGAVMKMGDKGAMSIETVPTGALALDLALGIGGIPRGRVVEIFGPEGSGKTTLATHVVAEAQRKRRYLRLHRCRTCHGPDLPPGHRRGTSTNS
ncbi:MAG: hypothetical protein Ct9H300mP12_14980 [Acidimicrobiales bacterium]|nr:MAG: hypothetical protein Ct9H300mP12_14980 [Acidimicrobiales bacterium]